MVMAAALGASPACRIGTPRKSKTWCAKRWKVGGVNYLIFMGATRPDLFLPLVGRTLPLKLQSDPGAAVVMVVSERIVTDAPKK